MQNPLSKKQIDQLGDRLRDGSNSEEDLRLLDEYIRSFAGAYETVVQKLRECGVFPSSRERKWTLSIIEKLRREKMRLSRMQDIAGCRVVVADIVRQDEFVAMLKTLFPEAREKDRRDAPSHGYRAVHIIPSVDGKPIEIQVRTTLQHRWAELSEKSSDVLDPAIKHGGGSESQQNLLIKSSESVALFEQAQAMVEKGDLRVLVEFMEKHGHPGFAKQILQTLLQTSITDLRNIAADERACLELMGAPVAEIPQTMIESFRRTFLASSEKLQEIVEKEDIRAFMEYFTESGIPCQLIQGVQEDLQPTIMRLRDMLEDDLSDKISFLEELERQKQ